MIWYLIGIYSTISKKNFKSLTYTFCENELCDSQTDRGVRWIGLDQWTKPGVSSMRHLLTLIRASLQEFQSLPQMLVKYLESAKKSPSRHRKCHIWTRITIFIPTKRLSLFPSHFLFFAKNFHFRLHIAAPNLFLYVYLAFSWAANRRIFWLLSVSTTFTVATRCLFIFKDF